MKKFTLFLICLIGFQMYAQLGDSRFYGNFYLKVMEIDGMNTTIKSNGELDYINFNFFENTDNFVISACRTGEALINPDSFSFTLASDFVWDGTACQEPVNNAVEEAFFQFFQDNATDLFSLSVGYYGANDEEVFIDITAQNGDYLYFDTAQFLNINDFEKENIVLLYPNPVNEELSVSNPQNKVFILK